MVGPLDLVPRQWGRYRAHAAQCGMRASLRADGAAPADAVEPKRQLGAHGKQGPDLQGGCGARHAPMHWAAASVLAMHLWASMLA